MRVCVCVCRCTCVHGACFSVSCDPHTHAHTYWHAGSSEPDTNVTFVRRSQGSSHESELEWESELSDAIDEDTTPRPSLHEPQSATKIPTTPIKRSMSDNHFEVSVEEGDGDEETLKAALNSTSHSEKMALELDEASRVLQ